jgi:hypothetical protein
MQISQTREQIKALSALQANAEIHSITLLSCNVLRAKAGTKFQEPYSVKPVVSNIASSRQNGFLVVEVSFEYSAWDSSEPSERLFQVNCTFEASYQLSPEYSPTPEQVSSFCRGTALFNCWPYAREFLRDITSRIGHQTPTLPLLRIVPRKVDPAAQETIETTATMAEISEGEED